MSATTTQLSEDVRNSLKSALRDSGVVYAVVFGSAAKGELTFESDIDIAVSAKQALSADQRCKLIEKIGAITLRPVDLLDLKAASGLVYAHAMAGEELFCDSAAAKGDALYRRVTLVADDLEFADRMFEATSRTMFS
jgi:predicted nucleotidyltransferase